MRRAPPPVLALLVLLVAGCAAPAATLAPHAAEDREETGCDATRPAVPHGADGMPPRAPPAVLPIPCEHPTGGISAEPTLGICPETGTVFHYPAVIDAPLVTKAGVARSRDQGATWDVIVPASAEAPIHTFSLDPYLYVDPATCRVFVDDLVTPNCSALSWSDDEGATWTTSLVGCAEFDHQNLFAGPPTTSTTVGYPNVVYRCAANVVALAGGSTAATCLKSLDGGLTFLPTGEPAFTTDPRGSGYGNVPGYCDGAVGHGTAGPDGVIYLPKGWCGQPYVAISRDEGFTWTRVQVASLGMSTATDGLQEHEAGVGVDPEGNVYYAWVAADRLPYLSISRDGGATWSAPRMVAPPGLQEAALPELAVGGVGKLALVYMGSFDSPRSWGSTDCGKDVIRCAQAMGALLPPDDYADATWSAIMTMSVDALEDEPTFLSATVNAPTDPYVTGTCGPVRCQQVYDFLDVRIGPDGTPWGAFIDAEGGGVAGRLVGGPSLL